MTPTSSRNEQLPTWEVNTIAALPGIVQYMNAHHLGNTIQVPADATGGILGPPPWPWLP
jgi:hypothetical protein